MSFYTKQMVGLGATSEISGIVVVLLKSVSPLQQSNEIAGSLVDLDHWQNI